MSIFDRVKSVIGDGRFSGLASGVESRVVGALDRAISGIAPRWGLSRARSRAVMGFLQAGGYAGASRDRRSFLGWPTTRGDADTDTLPDLDILRARSRDLYRNTPLATGAVNTVTTNVIGSGLRLQARIDREYLGLDDETDDGWERRVEREFSLWADSHDCDASRVDDFYGLQSLAFMSTLLSGDVFVNLPMIRAKGRPYDLRIQMIEADRIMNPDNRLEDEKLAGGVEVDIYGAPVAYHVANRHPGAWQLNDGFKRIPAFGEKTGRRNMLHLYVRLRPGQRRGVPYLSPVIETLKQLGRYTEAELMAAVVAGMFTVFIKTDTGQGIESPFNPNEQITNDPKMYELGYGLITELKKNEDISLANPQRPNQAFEPFMQAIIRFVGTALDLPHEMLVKHFLASYSASRAALLEAWKFFRVRRAWMASHFCNPTYEAWMTEAVVKGRIQAPGFLADPAARAAYLGAEWIGPTPGQIDPKKEVEAAILRIGAGLSTRAEETQALNGGDWERKHRQRAKEERMRREDGLAGEEQVSKTDSEEDIDNDREE